MIKRIVKNLLVKPRPGHIVVVSGLPRSGTSMMMKMLVAGGIPALTDGLRQADTDNPKGYFEFEQVKKLREGDTAWLSSARGKAVKIIAALILYLPDRYHYRIVFMRRAMNEILASQRKMLVNRGEDPDAMNEQKIGELFLRHLQQIEIWLKSTSYVEHIDIDYNGVLHDSSPYVERLNAFLGGGLDMDAMKAAVDTSLYRQRSC